MFSEAAASRDGGAGGAGEIVAIGGGDTFDDAELAQAGEASGEGGGRTVIMMRDLRRDNPVFVLSASLARTLIQVST